MCLFFYKVTRGRLHVFCFYWKKSCINYPWESNRGSQNILSSQIKFFTPFSPIEMYSTMKLLKNNDSMIRVYKQMLSWSFPMIYLKNDTTHQVEYHPFQQPIHLMEYCRREGIAFEGYSPLAKGQVLSDPTVLHIAEKHRRTPAQICIRWSIQVVTLFRHQTGLTHAMQYAYVNIFQLEFYC